MRSSFQKLKALVRAVAPGGLVARYSRLRGDGIHFSGRYPNWDDAARRTDGYDGRDIFEKVRAAALKVKSGAVAYERDSVVFSEIHHSFPVLSGLLRAAAEHNGALSVLDFGGSLGSSYFQCRNFLSVLSKLTWGIVEQEHFVRCGREEFETSELRFFRSIAECDDAIRPTTALLSGTLQYLPRPFDVLDELMDRGIPYLVIDRIPFSDGAVDWVTVQKVSPPIYSATYASHVFSRRAFVERISERHRIVSQFRGNDGTASADGHAFWFGGIIARRK